MNKQRGVSMSGFLMLIAVLAFAAIIGMKLIPAYMQDKEVVRILQSIVQDPAMSTAPVSEIRMSLMKRIGIANITAIKADEVEIDKEGGKLTLSANYSVKIPLAANASLLLDFAPNSGGK
jgi:ABC-type dipeptide/oligopeptide/nickel transport system ATPase subunit